MKKFIAIVALFSVMSLSVFAEGTSYKKSSPDYSAVQAYNFDFKAELNNGKVYMKWNSYEGNDFKWYKVVRSQKNANPAYPEDGGIKYFPKSDVTESYDWAPKGTSYYRLCAITVNNDRHCSRVVKIVKDATDYKKTDYKKVDSIKQTAAVVKDKYTTYKKNHVSTSMKKRILVFVENFKKKLDASNLSDSQKIERIDTILGKLKVLKEKKKDSEKLVAIIDYLIEVLEEMQNNFDPAIDELEAIFQL